MSIKKHINTLQYFAYAVQQDNFTKTQIRVYDHGNVKINIICRHVICNVCKLNLLSKLIKKKHKMQQYFAAPKHFTTGVIAPCHRPLSVVRHRFLLIFICKCIKYNFVLKTVEDIYFPQKRSFLLKNLNDTTFIHDF